MEKELKFYDLVDAGSAEETFGEGVMVYQKEIDYYPLDGEPQTRILYMAVQKENGEVVEVFSGEDALKLVLEEN